MKLITYKNVEYYQSNLLKESNFTHAFFTKRYQKNVPRELQKELDLISNIHYLNQVHSNKVIQVSNTLNLTPHIADCLITKDKYQSLWIYTADCIPIIIADIKTRNIAACHSGLKGLKKQIISKTIKNLIEIGSKKHNLIFAIGPSINGDRYQVKLKDIDDLIIQITGERYKEKIYFLKVETKEEMISFFKKDSTPGRLLIDIQAVAILQLYKEGIKQYQIDLNRICTYSNPILFNSFRRDNNSLRQWSCIYS